MGLNTLRAQERSEAIFMLKIRHLKIASSLRSFMPFGYRNDGFFRGSFSRKLVLTGDTIG